MKNILLILISLIVFGELNAKFIENKGQVKNQHNVPAENVLFIHESEDYRVILNTSGFSYEVLVNDLDQSKKEQLLNKLDQNVKFKYHFHRVDFVFNTKNFNVEKLEASKTVYNYVSGEKTCRTKGYNKVVYRDVQPGLHIEFVIDDEGQFKYNIISESSHDLNAFSMQILGAEDLVLNANGQLEISTEFGEIIEEIPYSYIQLENGRKKEVDIFYNLDQNTLRFSSERNLANKSIVIDPEPYVEWSTYFGGGGFDWGMDVTVDDNENSYQTGLTTSMSNVATTGAFQGSFSGDIDGYLTKFDTDGELIWATYFGGDQTDRTYAITSDNNGNIYVGGSTFSENNIATSGSLQPFIWGMDDSFFMKFDSDGQRIWGTYHGGEAHDFPVAMIHNNNDIFITGHTVSANNISTTGTFLPTKDASEAAFLISITDNGANLNWGTYLGSNGNSSGEAIDLLSDGRIAVAGRTTADADIASNGAHQDAFTGFVQGFLVVFNTNGTRDWGTYYGGDFSNRADAVAVLDDDIYLAGNTNSNNNIATPGAYQTTRTDEHGFLAKFNDQGVRAWGTYVGGNMEDAIKTVAAKNRMIIVGGHTRSTTSIASPGAFQETRVDNFDGFFNAFTTTGDYLWGTYLGGEDDENINRIMYLNDNAFVFSGTTSGSEGEITYGNTYQSSFGGGPDDVFSGKFFIPCKEITVGGDISLCEGDEDTLIASGVGNINWYVDNTLFAANDTALIAPTSTTTYEAVLTDYTNCTDTQSIEVTVNTVDDPSFTFFNYCFDAPNGPTNIATPNGTFSFDPLPADGASIDEVTGEITNGVLYNTYNVKYVTDGLCPDSSIVEVTVLETDDPSFEYTNLCENEPITPTNIATNGGTFNFAIPPSNNETIDANTGEIFNAVGGTAYEVTYTTPTGSCQASQTEEILILEAPSVNAGQDFESCIYHDSIQLSGAPMGGAFSGSGVANNYFYPNTAGIGTHELLYIYTGSNGCSNSDTLTAFVDECLHLENYSSPTITVYPNPANASFTIHSEEIITKVSIVDQLGKVVMEQKNMNTKTKLIRIHSLSPGSYLIHIMLNNSYETKKLIKK